MMVSPYSPCAPVLAGLLIAVPSCREQGGNGDRIAAAHKGDDAASDGESDAAVDSSAHESGSDSGSGGGGNGGSPGLGGTPPAATGGVGGASLIECGGVPCLLQIPRTCCVGNVCGLTDLITGVCVDPLAAFRDGGTVLESIVSDPACEAISFSFFGTPFTLPGCCDMTGVCGGNTGELPAPVGLTLPTLCLTPTEGAAFFLTGSVDVPCGADAGGVPDDAGGADAQPAPGDAAASDVVVGDTRLPSDSGPIQPVDAAAD